MSVAVHIIETSTNNQRRNIVVRRKGARNFWVLFYKTYFTVRNLNDKFADKSGNDVKREEQVEGSDASRKFYS